MYWDFILAKSSWKTRERGPVDDVHPHQHARENSRAASMEIEPKEQMHNAQYLQNLRQVITVLRGACSDSGD